ncbi:MAG: alpha-E domain-containing protein [Clostridiales bacterium]|nr:alpha-E domain-containing protein [Clostridiales bacterium]
MSAFSLSTTNRLFWMGRYSERVFTTLQYMIETFDKMHNGKSADYINYCKCVGIPNIYQNQHHFCSCYLFDTTNPDSVITSIIYLYDNAAALEEIVSAEMLSYIDLAFDTMKKAKSVSMEELQAVMENILAFRDSWNSLICDESIHNIVRNGISIERLDLYLRLDYHQDQMQTEFRQLLTDLDHTKLPYDNQRLFWLRDVVLHDRIVRTDVYDLIDCVDGLFMVE